jgi:TRAP-type C4-dicarboxylate transport system permease small subunit
MVRKTIRALDSVIQRLTHIFVVIAGCLTVLMIFTTVYGVVARYFFRRPEPVSYELSTIILLWGFLFAISSVERLDQHIRAEIFIQFASERVRNFLHRIVGPFLALFFCIALTWKGWTVAMYSLKIGERSMSVWAEPLGPIKLVVPICYGLLTLVVFSNFCRGLALYLSHGGAHKA